MKQRLVPALVALTLAAPLAFAQAEEKVLNLYSARHYQTDEQLYGEFTRQTGIKINRIEANDAALFERLKNEGKNSPADVIIMVDAARIWRAENDGFFQPVKSAVLDQRIPANLRGKDEGQGSPWYGFSKRARVIVYNKATVKPEDVATYEALADPRNKGKVCTRSGSHPYNLSLVGSLIERNGEKAAEEWAKGMVANFARPPRGGDTDQIKGVATGECGVAITNSYYYVRLLRSTKPEEVELMKNVGFVWPNAATTGTHFNIGGGGVAAHAPHRENAIKFLEYLASDEAQHYFADGNNEWPVVASVPAKNPTLDSLGTYKIENVSVAAIGKNQIAAQRILDRVGYK
ncbi:iron deficiency-induced protein A [Oxalicibacterium flavum]|uniref:Iron deficiency-induced protein A n=1 Tax=Oxalicibacterium flavum TaxID=179467 RepID=A0A8J2UQ79_9BURK|nr:Fe(3+) ABC transporter substrate-binding protein [Oxalicibacterium flavum]GGC05048.1 iron deficiency-induced protein A [Oxalicibacterium flavum]